MKRPLEPSAEGRGRVVGITDGVFAIALTLIVLEIRVPSRETVHSESELITAITALAPRFLPENGGFREPERSVLLGT
ncbi:TMEM175 family protein [Mesorhizobium sp.]|uniref:TMEM175 family protein n=1 Tax=Mesorhizobium sp. TaxID=1871066 RepID=UPI0025E8733B|nr:TMEM175 family protein [Mesorhizobium sp.]